MEVWLETVGERTCQSGSVELEVDRWIGKDVVWPVGGGGDEKVFETSEAKCCLSE